MGKKSNQQIALEYRIDKHKLTHLSKFVFGGPYGPNFELF